MASPEVEELEWATNPRPMPSGIEPFKPAFRVLGFQANGILPGAEMNWFRNAVYNALVKLDEQGPESLLPPVVLDTPAGQDALPMLTLNEDGGDYRHRWIPGTTTPIYDLNASGAAEAIISPSNDGTLSYLAVKNLGHTGTQGDSGIRLYDALDAERIRIEAKPTSSINFMNGGVVSADAGTLALGAAGGLVLTAPIVSALTVTGVTNINGTFDFTDDGDFGGITTITGTGSLGIAAGAQLTVGSNAGTATELNFLATALLRVPGGVLEVDTGNISIQVDSANNYTWTLQNVGTGTLSLDVPDEIQTATLMTTTVMTTTVSATGAVSGDSLSAGATGVSNVGQYNYAPAKTLQRVIAPYFAYRILSGNLEIDPAATNPYVRSIFPGGGSFAIPLIFDEQVGGGRTTLANIRWTYTLALNTTITVRLMRAPEDGGVAVQLGTTNLSLVGTASQEVTALGAPAIDPAFHYWLEVAITLDAAGASSDAEIHVVDLRLDVTRAN